MRLRSQRGYVILFVMLSLMFMSLIVANLYAQAQSLTTASRIAVYSQIATANAVRGLQEAYRAIRNGEILIASIDANSYCNQPKVNFTPLSATTVTTDPNYVIGWYKVPGACSGATPYIERPVGGMPDSVPSPTGLSPSPSRGEGLQYTYVVYVDGFTGNPRDANARVYTVEAVGYAGLQLPDGGISPNAVPAVVRGELVFGNNLSTNCRGSYDCS